MSDTNRAAEISAALMPAYQNASKLKLNKEEIKRLTKPFAEKDFEIVPTTGAIYLPHILLSQRLNQVFGPGSWSLICREHREKDERTIYAEHCLVVRGCFVGESVDEFPVDVLNTVKYGDSLEATAAKALRKICGKRLSCGEQAWQSDFCQKWQEKFAESVALENGGTAWKKKGSKLSLDSLNETPVAKPGKPAADENLRHVMLQILSTQGNANVLTYAISEGILKEGQTLDEWPLNSVAIGEREIRQLQLKIQKHFEKPPQAGDWKEFEIPFGTFKDKRIGEIEKDDICALWEIITDEKQPAIGKKHPEFKNALIDAGKEFGFSRLKKAN